MGFAGLDIAGADLVEVSPPFDTGGSTAWLGASPPFEPLCVMVPGGDVEPVTKPL